MAHARTITSSSAACSSPSASPACMLRRNIIIIFMCLELMLNAANLTLVAFSPLQRRRERPAELQRAGAGLLHHHRRRRGGRRRPGDHRRALPRAPDDARGGPQLAQVLAQWTRTSPGSSCSLRSLRGADPSLFTQVALALAQRSSRSLSSVFGFVAAAIGVFATAEHGHGPAQLIEVPGSTSAPRCCVPIGLIVDDLSKLMLLRRHRRRRADPHLFARSTWSDDAGEGALLRQAVALHVLDARHRARGQLRR